ncbi:MAG: sulfotransferase [Acidimicrobiia bacterium]|nr:sulfotransferase [Acidimicrobiia bacterium]
MSELRGPDLLVIGAARAGTTALCRTLARHAEVYLTKPKETHFLSFAGEEVRFTGPGDDEMINQVVVTEPDRWRQLCATAQAHTYRCDGSVSTLFYYERSIGNIRTYVGDRARMIVSLREPVQRAFSSYLYLTSRGYETAPTFDAALADEVRRRDEGWHHLWQYEAMSHYGPQLSAFVDAFGRDALFVFTHDEFRRERHDLLTRLGRWLDLDPGPMLADQSEVNTGGVPKSSLLQNAIRRARSSWVQPIVKRATSEQFREKVRTSNLERPELDVELRKTLAKRFSADVDVVEEIIGRSLPTWRG